MRIKWTETYCSHSQIAKFYQTHCNNYNFELTII
jgi:hypothetical protein